jgi:hypothetical protein
MWLNTSPNAPAGVNLLPFLANYATELAPDLSAKVAFEPGWGSGPCVDHPVVTMEAAKTFEAGEKLATKDATQDLDG